MAAGYSGGPQTDANGILKMKALRCHCPTDQWVTIAGTSSKLKGLYGRMYSIAGDPIYPNRIAVASYSGLFLINNITDVFQRSSNTSQFVQIQSEPTQGRRWHIHFDPADHTIIWGWDTVDVIRLDEQSEGVWVPTRVTPAGHRCDRGNLWLSARNTTWLAAGSTNSSSQNGVFVSPDKGHTWLEVINQTDVLRLRPMAWFDSSMYLTSTGAVGFTTEAGNEVVGSFHDDVTRRGVGVFRCIINKLPRISACPLNQTCLYKTMHGYSIALYDWSGQPRYGTAFARHSIVHRARYFDHGPLGPAVYLATQGVGMIARRVNDTSVHVDAWTDAT
eukprot:TRINITY_DN5077_c0_g1_i1.p1 TRINITY_DN5077_c0_g1~~TRINITY_DN5077_c0_g1_i1.p1  ORF type:complete len:378 (+),score=38.11 TRINITY_DN5077_c0_g1_i1:140-1135(+)